MTFTSYILFFFYFCSFAKHLFSSFNECLVFSFFDNKKINVEKMQTLNSYFICKKKYILKISQYS